MARVGGNITIFSAELVNGTGAVRSDSIDIGSHGTNFGIAIVATSVLGTPELLVQYEQSFTRPTTEGSADTNYVIPDGAPDIVTNLTQETYFITSVSAVPMNYIRILITGQAGNQTDTLVTAYFYRMEDA